MEFLSNLYLRARSFSFRALFLMLSLKTLPSLSKNATGEVEHMYRKGLLLIH